MKSKLIIIALIALCFSDTYVSAMNQPKAPTKSLTFKKLPLITAITEYGEHGIKVIEQGKIEKFNRFVALFYKKFSIKPFKTEKIYADIQEFDETFQTPTNLWLHCCKLNKRKNEGEILSAKENATLQFAHSMAYHEAEWKKWHTCEKLTEENVSKKGVSEKKASGKGTTYFFENVQFIEDEKNLISKILHYFGLVGHSNSKKIITRMDINSSHFMQGKLTDLNNHEERDTFFIYNILENQAFHDELKFLTTQLHKMKLFWGIKPEAEKTTENKQDYKQTKSLLKKEIAAFTNPINRESFTRSCMKTNDFELVQKMRNAYKNPLNE